MCQTLLCFDTSHADGQVPFALKNHILVQPECRSKVLPITPMFTGKHARVSGRRLFTRHPDSYGLSESRTRRVSQINTFLEVTKLKRLILISLSLLLLTIIIPGCITFQTAPATTPSPGTPSVIGTFSSTPATISSGGTSTLLWNVTGATSVSIDQGIGQVEVAGTRVVSPAHPPFIPSAPPIPPVPLPGHS